MNNYSYINDLSLDEIERIYNDIATLSPDEQVSVGYYYCQLTCHCSNGDRVVYAYHYSNWTGYTEIWGACGTVPTGIDNQYYLAGTQCPGVNSQYAYAVYCRAN